MASSNLLSHEEYVTIASRQLRTSDIQVVEARVGPIGSGVTGFMGDHLQIQLTVLESRTGQRHELNFFAKAIPTAVPDHTKYVLSLRAYEKETVAYSTILPSLKACLVTPLRCSCDSYLTRPDLIVLENLATQGFRLHDNLQCLDYAHITLVLKNLAQLHAASIIFEEENSAIKDIYKNVLFENLFSSIEGNSGRNWFLTGVRAAMHIIEYLPKYGKDSEFYYEIKDKFPEVCKQMWELVKPSQKYRNVFCHGDLWNNNIMVRYENEKPVEVRFVDFQMYRYNPPVSDLLFFLYLTTRRAYRESHLEEFLTLYYKTFSEELRLKGYDAERLLTWAELKESYEKLQDLGRIAAVICDQICFMNSEALAPYISSLGVFKSLLEQDRNKEVLENFQRDPTYRDRLGEAVEELIECTVLKNLKE